MKRKTEAVDFIGALPRVHRGSRTRRLCHALPHSRFPKTWLRAFFPAEARVRFGQLRIVPKLTGPRGRSQSGRRCHRTQPAATDLFPPVSKSRPVAWLLTNEDRADEVDKVASYHSRLFPQRNSGIVLHYVLIQIFSVQFAESPRVPKGNEED